MSTEPDLTVPQVAAKLVCNPETVRRLINTPGGLRATKPAGKWLIDPADLEAFKESKANRPKTRQRRQRAS
jgi:excisionase family DNA binding protein